MKIYAVGGAVRDELLGLPVQDRDYVVVGATPEKMVALGYTPVGKDFPVFLHPVTHEEYALARTERKTAPGYKGFVFHTSPEVTLEDDLIRRDLTINAMAQAEDGAIVDPFAGQRDLQAKLFRHVSEAFAEDPVRILRVARFAARFTEFTVAPETNALMQRMVHAGEVDALVPERVWQELARGLMEKKPSRMFEVLRACGALERILPELDILWRAPQAEQNDQNTHVAMHVMRALDSAAQKQYALPIRFAVLMHDIGKGATLASKCEQERGLCGVRLVEQVCSRLKIPNDCRDLAIMTAREHSTIVSSFDLQADAVVTLLERNDAFRKPQRFIDMLHACECNFAGIVITGKFDFPQLVYLTGVLRAVRAVNTGAIAAEISAQSSNERTGIPSAIHAARVGAARDFINQAMQR
jgi:tRNA nucleotidyltransferase (CCA-adding enzyme)